MQDEFLTKNFKRAEFACKGEGCCGGSAPINLKLVNLAQCIRDLACVRAKRDVPIAIMSGFRCCIHNARVGGRSGSHHLFGDAADITAPTITLTELHACAKEAIRRAGYGYSLCYYDRGFVHVDIRGWHKRQ